MKQPDVLGQFKRNDLEGIYILYILDKKLRIYQDENSTFPCRQREWKITIQQFI